MLSGHYSLTEKINPAKNYSWYFQLEKGGNTSEPSDFLDYFPLSTDLSLILFDNIAILTQDAVLQKTKL